MPLSLDYIFYHNIINLAEVDLSLALPEISFMLHLLKEVLEDVVCPDLKAHCGIMVFEIELHVWF